jgi:hypothetical protein
MAEDCHSSSNAIFDDEILRVSLGKNGDVRLAFNEEVAGGTESLVNGVHAVG